MERAELIVEFILGVKWVGFLGVVLWCFRDPITSLINQIKNIKVSGANRGRASQERHEPLMAVHRAAARRLLVV